MDYLRITNTQNTHQHKCGVRIAEKAPVSFPLAELPISLLSSVWLCSLVPQVVIDDIISRFLETHFHQSQMARDVLRVSSGYFLWSNAFENNPSMMSLWYYFSLSQKTFVLHLFIWVGVGMQECHLECGSQRTTWRNLEVNSLLPICGSGDWAQVVSIGNKYPYQLSHLTRP